MTTQTKKIVDVGPPWFLHAQTFERAGVMDVHGPGAHPTILTFFTYTTLKGTKYALTDETAWCSAFVCAVLEQCDLKSTKSAAARSWLKWGCEIKEPRLGCIVVSERKSSANATAAHVALYAGHVDAKSYASLGGNQANRVCTRPKPYAEVIGYRWPVVGKP